MALPCKEKNIVMIKQIMILGISVLVVCIFVVMMMRNKRNNALSYRLTWFELQISPVEYRFAIIPKQPILIGPLGENESIILVRHEIDPVGYDKTVEKMDKVIQELKVLELPQINPEKCFADKAIEQETIHLRFRYSNNISWSSCYDITNVPPQILKIIEKSKDIGLAFLSRETNKSVDANMVDDLIGPENNPYDLAGEGIVLKIHINENGEIEINGKKSLINQLKEQLDILKKENGTVWYSRYNPEEDPEKIKAVVNEVLNEITKRNLPIKLNVIG